MTPELVTEVVKQNPFLVLHTLQKFKTFNLVGSAMDEKQQILFSKNLDKVSGFLSTEDGKTHVKLFVDGFGEWITKQK